MGTDDPGLERAARQVHDVFARYPLRNDVDGCTCCVSGEDQTALRGGSPEALARYSHKAMSTWGDDLDFRHFLPRLLTACASGAVDLDTVTGKLRQADWHTWPGSEQDAVRDYLTALWRHTLAMPDHRDLADVLDDLARAGLPATALLDMVLDLPAETRALRIADLVGTTLRTEVDLRDADVVRRLTRARTAQLLEAAFFAAEDPGTAGILSTAVDELGWLTGP